MDDVRQWLTSLGLTKYAQIFAANEIDFAALAQLTESDLKELAVPIGPRRKLLNAIAELRPEASLGRETAGEQPDLAERRQLTVMFVDLVNSTPLSTRLDPEELRTLLRKYQNAVAGEITRFEGYVAKLMGDGVLAYFGWPRAHEEDAERAVRAGLAIVEAVGGLAGPHDEPLASRIGIATGVVVVGDLIGEGAAREQAVTGATPNLAARLQEVAGPQEVIIAETTRRLVPSAFEFQDLGRRGLKGFTEPVRLFRVVRERSAETRFGTRTEGHVAPMVGREEELALLLRAWRLACAGEGQALLLAGEAGIGKSRLLHALVEAAATNHLVRLSYQCSPFHADSPLWPVAQQMAHSAGFTTGDDPSVRHAKLVEMLRPAVSDVEEACRLLGPLLGIPHPSDADPDLVPQERRARTIAAIVEQLQGLARLAPVLVVFEDAHWIDSTSLELLRGLLDAVSGDRVLLVITTRPEGESHFAGTRRLMRLALSRLDRAAASTLIADIAADQSLPVRLRKEIFARADGIPLFVEELTKAVLESGDTTGVPASLHDSLVARLDRLPAMKTVAQIAACFGREFEYHLLEAVADLPSTELNGGIAALVHAELVFHHGSGATAIYRFKHALVRDAAYESLLKQHRLRLHQRIAQTIEKTAAHLVDQEPELLAHHWFAAGHTTRAVDYWLRAQQRAAHWEQQFDALAEYLDAEGVAKD